MPKLKLRWYLHIPKYCIGDFVGDPGTTQWAILGHAYNDKDHALRDAETLAKAYPSILVMCNDGTRHKVTHA